MEDNWQVLISIVETALELIPESVYKQIPQKQQRRATSSSKDTNKTHALLDVSYHHQWMAHLKNPEKRGRPDILHRVLLAILDSPLNHLKNVNILVETITGQLLWIRKDTRIPRDYNRFCGVVLHTLTSDNQYTPHQIVQCLTTNSFPNNQWFLPVKGDLKEFINIWKPSSIYTLTEKGTPVSILEISKKIQQTNRPMIIVGGFQKGKLSSHSLSFTDQQYRIYNEPLPSSTVISRILAGLEIVFELDHVQE